MAYTPKKKQESQVKEIKVTNSRRATTSWSQYSVL